MTYATVEDMIARFSEDTMIQLTDLDREGKVNHEKAELALNDASAEINGYLGRYHLPFKEIPPILTRLCCDIARYCLCSSSAVLMNDDIANGLITLGIKADGAQVDTGDVVEFAPSSGRVFGRRR